MSDFMLMVLCVCVPQVEEVKKHSHCLAFSSAGPQSQTYYVSFDSFTEHLRWHRHAAKVLCAAQSHMLPRCCSRVSCIVHHNMHDCDQTWNSTAHTR